MTTCARLRVTPAASSLKIDKSMLTGEAEPCKMSSEPSQPSVSMLQASAILRLHVQLVSISHVTEFRCFDSPPMPHNHRNHYRCPSSVRSQSNNILLMGCNVVEGEGTGLIIATGKQNQLSRIASSAGVDAAPTSLQVGVVMLHVDHAEQRSFALVSKRKEY